MKTIAHIIAALALAGAALQAHPSSEHSLEEIQSHLDAHPDDPALLLAKATQLRKMSRYDEAEQSLLRVDMLAPDLPGAMLERAQISYYRSGDALAAEGLAKALVEKHPRDAEGWEFLGQLQRKMGKKDEAINSLRRALALTTEHHAAGFTDLANLLVERDQDGDRDEAIQVLDQGIAKLGKLTGLYLMAANLEVSLKRYEAAARRYDKLAANFRPRPDWARQKGDIYMEAQRYPEAARAYDSALAIISSLPAERQKGEEMQKLISEIQTLKKTAKDKVVVQ